MFYPTSDLTQDRICFDREITIVDGDDTSEAIDLRGTSIVAILTDSAWDGSTLTFLAASSLTGTYKQVVDSSTGSVVTVTIAANKYGLTLPADLAGMQYCKVVSSATQSGANTIITLATRPLA
jgi:hypothetical protein